jgi:hypothetical protein
LLGILAVGQGGDDPSWLLLIAYDREQPSAWADVATVKPRSGWQRIGLNVIGMRDGLHDRVEVAGEFWGDRG